MTEVLQALPAHRALEIGKAAEHLVCADLILSGHRAFLTDQGLPYDVVFDHKGRLFRVQVKATGKPRDRIKNPRSCALAYCFGIRRYGKAGKRVQNSDFDLLALVALDIRTIAYMPLTDKVFTMLNLRVPGSSNLHFNKKWKNIDDYPIEDAIEKLTRRK